MEDHLCDIKEQESGNSDMKLEATQLKAKKQLLTALLENTPEALRSVEMFVGPAVSSSSVRLGSSQC